jgi:DNA-directed RNA polymerase subunit F
MSHPLFKLLSITALGTALSGGLPLAAQAETVGAKPAVVTAAPTTTTPPTGLLAPMPHAGDHMQHRSPEERAKHHALMEEKLAKLPPEKQAEIRAKMAERHQMREAMREKIKAMKPEEREAFMKQWHAEHGMGHTPDMVAPVAPVAPAAPIVK